MKKIVLFLLIFAFVVTPIGGASDARSLDNALTSLQKAIESVGVPRSSEARAQLDEIKQMQARLRFEAAAVRRAIERADSEKRALERHVRDIDDRQRQLDYEQQVLDSDRASFLERVGVHNAEAARQHAAVAAATTQEALASANAWGAQITERKRGFDREQAELAAREDSLASRRAALDTERSNLFIQENRAGRYRLEADQEVTRFLSEVAVAISRAVALKQIVDSPSPPAAYEPPDKIAEKVVGDLFKSIGSDAALKGLKSRTMLKLLGKSLTKVAGTVYTLADLGMDATIAGVEQRNLEVEKNIFLIGEYGKVMKAMIRNSGPDAVDDPEYQAIRDELERLKADMPASDAEVLTQGLASSAALTKALMAQAAKYATKPVEKYAGTVTDHLNAEQRETLGKGGVKFFKEAIKTVSTSGAENIISTSAEEMQKAVSAAREEQARR